MIDGRKRERDDDLPNGEGGCGKHGVVLPTMPSYHPVALQGNPLLQMATDT